MKHFLFVISSFLLLLFACGQKEIISTPKTKIVAVSLPPYEYFVKRIAADTVTITPLVPAQSNPHLFETTPKQVQEIHQAQLWIRSREYFENKILSALKEQNPNLPILDLSKNLSDDDEDRHTWLSPKIAKQQAVEIAEALVQLNPEHETLYRDNLKEFLTDLDSLDKKMAGELAPYKDQSILTSHPAFGFFCQDYGLVQLSIECEGKDPLPQDLERTLHQAKTHQIARIFTQPQYNNRGAELIADQLHLDVCSIDPYSSDYLENLTKITQFIIEK